MSRFGRLLALACVLAIALQTERSAAETIYSAAGFELTANGSGTGRTCQLLILPDQTAGADAPRLLLETFGGSDLEKLTLSIGDRSSYRDVMLVQDNQRNETLTLYTTYGQGLFRTSLGRAIEKGRPFAITAKSASGDAVSSRFTATAAELREMLARIGRTCPFDADSLLPTGAAMAAERALNLRAAQITHIRWLLTRKYAPMEGQPGDSAELLPTDRARLKRYALDNALPISGFLSREIADRLLADIFLPAVTEFSGSDRAQHDSWFSFVQTADDGDLLCTIATNLLSSSDVAYWTEPHMLFRAWRSQSGSSMVLDMASPNPFSSDAPVRALVDGEPFDLTISANQVEPSPTSGSSNLDNSVMVAIRRGRSIEIVGTSQLKGEFLSLTFSASGFTKALNRMISDCNRDGLSAWIN